LFANTAMTAKELASRCGVTEATIKDRLKVAIEEGVVEERYHPDEGVSFYSLRRNCIE